MSLIKVKSRGTENVSGANNVIINGGMKVAQRATTKTGLTNFNNGYHTLDRWRFQESGSPSYQFTMSQSTTSPNDFGYSLKMDCTTAQGSLAAGDTLQIQHRMEGQNLQQFQKGTSTAKQWTMSFFVRSALTGTYICQLFDNDNNRFVSKSYTIDSANTWERKIITFPADTTGALNNSNGNNLIAIWYLAAGSDFTSGTLQTTWGGNTSANKAVGQVNLASSTSNDWYMTGAQLELGDSASDFNHRSFADELLLCQRYFHKVQGSSSDRPGIGGYVVGATEARMDVVFPCAMRGAPTIGGTGTAQFDGHSDSADFNCSAIIIDEVGTGIISGLGIQIATSGMTNGHSGGLRFRSDATLTFDSEI
tara:strand:- start:294 stop:1385 length:1092 start_codon:yes stop_codon:yes gene_type:complete